MKKIFSKEMYIGLSVIVAIIIFVVGIDYLKGINLFQPANFYVAEYENVAGLELSAPVNIRGYKVGQVREINFDYEHPGKIKVVLALNEDLKLPDDSEAIIASTLLSGAYIEIKVGSSNQVLPVGGNIKTGMTPDLMASLSDDIMPKVSQVVPRVDTLLYNLNGLVTDPALRSSLVRLDGISNNLLLASRGLNGTLNQDVPVIMRNARHITTNVDTLTANLIDLSVQLKSLPLEPTMQNIEEVTRNLEAFSAQLNSREGTLGKLMNDPELYDRLSKVSADVDSLIIDIKKNPKRYISIKLL
ncbi:MAG: MlaD family protein [Clostridium sp.]|nr:MlaD family protein [Prevotella sp.]MCM1428843.1 MlaD family protein [Clostridium sp.]MCM1475218.1 MlaD family protein [Muribaculaceae bacterium]